PVTAVLTTFIYSRLLKHGLWNKAKDETESDDPPEQHDGPTPSGETSPAGDDPGTGQAGSVAVAERQAVRRVPPLQISLLPILVPLVLIAFGAIAEAAGLESEVISFVGDPVFALFVGLVGAYLLARRTDRKSVV